MDRMETWRAKIRLADLTCAKRENEYELHIPEFASTFL